MTKEEYFDAIHNTLLYRQDFRINVAVGFETFTLQQCLTNYGKRYEGEKHRTDVLEYTLISKCKDYTAIGDSPFKNFEAYNLVGVSTEQGIKTRIIDKVSRIHGLIQNATNEGAVRGESLADTWLDLAGYIVILYIYNNQDGHKVSEPNPRSIRDRIEYNES